MSPDSLVHLGVAPTLAFLGQIGPLQWVIIGIFALLIFGKRLPQVGKSLGQGIVEFKKGLQGLNDEIESATKEVKDADPRKLDQQETKGPSVTEKRETESTQA
ncbi:MAG: twin-arginine translocase TatA/TatE family subunit [Planctomycetota bacterium]